MKSPTPTKESKKLSNDSVPDTMHLLRRLLYALIPRSLLIRILSPYHYSLALLGALIYGYPSRELFVIAVTGTKGKSSTAEITAKLFEEAGLATALASTIRFSINGKSSPNRFKMTMPGRFFLQRFLREALNAGATHAIIEMTSEGVLQHRHRFIDLDALIFTNITHEHIEAHGSFEKYLEAKLEIAHALERSSKKNRFIVANGDDSHAHKFLAMRVEHTLSYSLKDAEPYTVRSNGIGLTYENTYMSTPLRGTFNLSNVLGAITLARAKKVSLADIRSALAKLSHIPGRLETVETGAPAQFIVDYAHTPESLEAVYRTFPQQRKIGVLGNTGGGRDTWKRPVMGAIADEYCDEIILTDEDPYDEDQRSIVEDMQKGMSKHTPIIELDRRKAIARALSLSRANDIVLITGKGTDPFIMQARGKKLPWSDSAVVREEAERLLKRKHWEKDSSRA